MGWNLLKGWWETQLLVIPQEAATDHVDTCLTEGQLLLHPLQLPALLPWWRIFKKWGRNSL